MTPTITINRATVEQALEALEADCGGRCNAEYNPCWQREVAETLRAALAQQAEPVQEPVAKVELMMTGGNAGLATRIVEIDHHLRDRLRPGQLLYTAPPQQAEPTHSQKMTAAGFTRRPSLWSLQAREALELIAAPQRPDGTWNRDREACRQLAAEALGRYEDERS